MSIVAPNMPLLKILRRVLLSEMASKLNMTKEELEAYLNNKEYKEPKEEKKENTDCNDEMTEI